MSGQWLRSSSGESVFVPICRARACTRLASTHYKSDEYPVGITVDVCGEHCEVVGNFFLTMFKSHGISWYPRADLRYMPSADEDEEDES